MPCPTCRAPINQRAVRTTALPIAQIADSLHRMTLIVDDAAAVLRQFGLSDEGTAATRLKPVMPFSTTCSFCPLGVDPALIAPDCDLGPVAWARAWKAPGDTTSLPKLPIHQECVYAAHRAARHQAFDEEKGGRDFVYIHSEYAKSCQTFCARSACGKRRATVACAIDDCPRMYHLVCAHADGAALPDDGTNTVYCPDHASSAPRLDKRFIVQNKVSRTVAEASNDFCLTCGNGGDLLLCDTNGCPEVTHAKCAGYAVYPDTWFCGVCKAAEGYVCGGGDTPPAPKSLTRKRKRSSVSTSVRRRSRSHSSDALRPLSANPPATATTLRTTFKRQRIEIRILPTLLSVENQRFLDAVGKKHKFRVIIEKDFSPRVTHILVDALDPRVRKNVPRSVKLCLGIAAQLPIVCCNWVRDVLSQSDFPSPSLEIYLHPLTPDRSSAKLFVGKRFYFGPLATGRPKKEDFMKVVETGGGKVIPYVPTEDAEAHKACEVYIVLDPFASQQRKRRSVSLLSSTQPSTSCQRVAPEWILNQCMPT